MKKNKITARKYLHVSFIDGVLTLPLYGDDPLIDYWPSSKKVRQIIKADTITAVRKKADADDRRIRQYILHKVRAVVCFKKIWKKKKTVGIGCN